ncbi:hypothetical protein TSOC_001555 [Tetrabaena socialis]|uniref:Nucleotidyltransferase n=1 Tax=Tetrabaena socialis TaxID=47790 RepID=A0A2J8AGF0_9CHLO|nr:hypothetical protein TSOC_001555 [Tetrabaena socialis]|eukprot:PNH11591.1 hypothetical protein TSOC_001555 [Tetrabaena socialis]
MLQAARLPQGHAGRPAARAARLRRTPLLRASACAGLRATRADRCSSKSPAPSAARSRREAVQLLGKPLAMDSARQRTACQAIPGSKEDEAAFNSFLTRFSATDEERQRAGEVVKTVQDALHRMPDISVSRVEPVGSFGRRTMVNDFDVDLQAYVVAFQGRTLRYPEDWQPDGALQTSIRGMVAKGLGAGGVGGVKLVTIADDPYYRHVLQVGHKNLIWEQHEMLMRPVYDNPGAAMYDQLRERADTAALTKVTQSCSDDVKRVVRVTKAWVRRLEEDGRLQGHKGAPGDPRISSVALEVLVMAANQLQFRRRAPSGYELFVEALRLIVAAVEQQEVVMVDAGEWGYRRELGERCAAKNWKDHSVRIIHPTDPTCNLARPREQRPEPDWQGLANEARQLLELMAKDTFDAVRKRSTLGLL